MTLPAERTRSVVKTREFLIRLSSPYGGGIKGVPSLVRAEARRLLRHYPMWFDMGRKDAFSVTDAADETVEQWVRGLITAKRTGAKRRAPK
jgi:hypothetical protein